MVQSASSYILRRLADFVEWLNQRQSQPQKEQVLPNGVGAGLKFSPDRSNPDFGRGTYELPVQKALAQYLKPDNVFYDIGANIGFFTAIAAKLVGSSGRVYAFEPVPENVARIRRNLKLNRFSHATVLQKAVSDTTGKAELLLAHHSGGATLATAGTPPDLKGTMNVGVVSIDALVAEKTLMPPDLVKIDVEGAEVEVLKGMTQTIQEFKPAILYEVDDSDKESFQRRGQAIEAILKDLGYRIVPLEAAYPGIAWNVGHAIALPQ